MYTPVKIKHVDDIPAKKSVDDVTDNTRIKKRLRNRGHPPLAKDGPTLPDQETKRNEPENRERPNLPLKHPPRTPSVLNVGKIENRQNGNRCGALEASRGDFLDHRVDQRQVGDHGKHDEEASHFASLSIALWHSMQVSTNG